MGIPGSKNGGTVPYKAIFWGDIPLHSPEKIGLLGIPMPNFFGSQLSVVYTGSTPMVSPLPSGYMAMENGHF